MLYTPARRTYRTATPTWACLIAMTVPAAASNEVLDQFIGPSSLTVFGRFVAAAGDVNNDGFADLIVSDTGGPNRPTLVFSGIGGTTLHAFTSFTGTFEAPAATAGDVDSDGHADIVLGLPGNGGGAIEIRSGGTGATLHNIIGAPNDLLGKSVAPIGDVDLDGTPDVLVGVHGLGVARVYSGSTGALLKTFTALNAELGLLVRPAGDVDADGVGEVMISGVHQTTSVGLVVVLSGTSGVELFRRTGGAPGDGFAAGISEAGDIDNDGHADVAISSTFVGIGELRVISGAGFQPLFVVSDTPEKKFGSSVRGGTDLSGDGIPDLIVGSAEFDAAGALHVGAVQVLSGVDASRIAVHLGSTANERHGESVDVIGDANGDGLPEFAVGGGGLSNQGPGRVVLYSGRCVSATAMDGYGVGCPGLGGFIPKLQVEGCVAAGCTGGVRISQALGLGPSTHALLFFGGGAGNTPVGFGCSLLLSQPLPLALVAPLGGALGPGMASADLVVPLPLSLAGVTIHVQAFPRDITAPLGYSVSNGVKLFIRP